MGETPLEKEAREFAEEQSSLWLILLGPIVWGAHFLISYFSAAVVCAKFPEDGLGTWRIAAAVLTVTALSLIVAIGLKAWRQWDLLDDFDWSHHEATGEHRHEFLGHAAVLLCGASFIGVAYAGLPVIFIATCT